MKKEINMCRIQRAPIEDRTGVKDTKREGKIEEETIITDPLGSWTGVTNDEYFDVPVQDADDL